MRMPMFYYIIPNYKSTIHNYYVHIIITSLINIIE